ncbi:heavy-metal-associated domain-containing protein [Tenacibaculum sp. 190524A02b]|uniref:HMA domain-containing protein n=1 Tax=Tenacibaculum vairaonense TaxID=3137860 RepID=A0ABP1FCE7_9FLAO
MSIKKITLIFTLISFLAISCKSQKEDAKEISLSISGMTCEIGCAKKIASDLSKKEGVIDAKVIFNDSIANIKYDANKTNKADLIAFVEGIAGNMYKASEISSKKEGNLKKCKANCEMACCNKTENKETKGCKGDCEKECCKAKTEEKTKTACASDCKKTCCDKTA